MNFVGPHFCDLCPSTRRVSGVANLLVPGEHAVCVAPELIAHSVEQHADRPPDQVIAAMMTCPQMNSPEYHAAIARNDRPFK